MMGAIRACGTVDIKPLSAVGAVLCGPYGVEWLFEASLLCISGSPTSVIIPNKDLCHSRILPELREEAVKYFRKKGIGNAQAN